MLISHDMYLYLIKFADDNTVLNMLSVNQKYNDPKYYHYVLKEKYPLLIPFKYNLSTLKFLHLVDKQENDWKHFYVEMINYISKINKLLGIPYINCNLYDPKMFYKDYITNGDHEKRDIFFLNRAMRTAAFSGNIKIVNLMIEKGADDFGWSMVWAAKGGNLNVVKSLIEKGSLKLNIALDVAIMREDYEMTKLFLENGAKTGFPKEAVSTGNVNIVKLLLEKNGIDVNRALETAVYKGFHEITKLLLKNGGKMSESALFYRKYLNIDISIL